MIISRPGFPPIVYSRVNPVIASLLVRSFLQEGDLCIELMLGALEENDSLPTVLELPRFRLEKRLLLRRCGLIDPEDIDPYIANGGYEALCRALQKEPAEVISIIGRSGLRGRGGAGFPAGRKWEICARAEGRPKYVIANADEGDPGAFMDRSLLESEIGRASCRERV